MEAVALLVRRPELRCRACYRLRLTEVANWAAAHGFEAIATTLTVSQYQDSDAIAEEGEAAARAAGLEYLRRDYRDRFGEAVRRSRQLGMYRQNYCGCVISELKVREQRRRGRAEKAGARDRRTDSAT
jgi:predicted adenine nucleotide alpha hydrolase (AANH) superfamily ATPase